MPFTSITMFYHDQYSYWAALSGNLLLGPSAQQTVEEGKTAIR